jgi:hypothetical protein
MKKVIYLEADEEITSVIDRIKQIKEGKVALVIPRRANVLQSIVNLKLLKKQVDNLNKEVIVITTDKLGRNLASQVGFTVYQKLGGRPVEVEPKPTIQRSPITKVGYRASPEIPKKEPRFKTTPSIADITYRKEEKKITPSLKEEKKELPKIIPRPSKEKPKLTKKPIVKKVPHITDAYKKIILILAIAFIFIAFLVCFIILPRAKTSLILKSDILEQSFDATISKEAKSPNFDKSILPGELVTIEKEEIRKDLACTGKKDIGQKASGTIIISNSYDENPQPLVANTRFVSTSNGRTYRITTAVTVPGAHVSGGEVISGTVQATVRAAESGPEYNIGSSHFTIPGLSGSAKYDKIYGDTTSSIKGGFTEEITVLSQADIDSNKDKIVTNLITKIEEEAESKYKGKKVFTDGLKPEVLEASPNIPLDTESAKFDLKVKVKIKTLTTDTNDFNYLVFKKLTSLLPDDKELIPDSLKETKTKIISFNDKSGKLAVKIEAKGIMISKIDKGNIKEAIAGKNREEAEEYLATLKDVSEARVNLWPFWVRSVPKLFKRNIEINIEIKK